MDVGNHQLALPQNRYAHFRITIRDVTSNQESELLELTRRLQGGKETERVERTAVERRPFRIDRIDFRDLHRDELLVSFPEARHEEYRVVIDNGDNPALAVTGVRGEGNAYQALFLAAPGVAYHLSYGSEAAKAPNYDTATLRESLARGYQPVVVRLSRQATASDVSEPTSIVMRRVLNNPFVLGGVILLLVAVLVWGLYRAG